MSIFEYSNEKAPSVLCRFRNPDVKSHLPHWIKDQIREYKDFGQAQRDLVCFFRDTQQKVSFFKDVYFPSLIAKRVINIIFLRSQFGKLFSISF